MRSSRSTARAVNAQRDVWLDLLDAVSGSAPITISVRTPDGVDAHGEPRRPERSRAAAPDRAVGDDERPGRSNSTSRRVPATARQASSRTARRRVPGLTAGDQIVAVNGEPVHDFLELQQLVQPHPDDELAMRYRRGSAQVSGAP